MPRMVTARDRVRRELRDIQHEQARLIDAIAAAGDVAALAVALKAREARRAALTRELARLEDRQATAGLIRGGSSATYGSASPSGAGS